MDKPLISIVIPTRERPGTLEICLRAMRHHRSPDIEIVVQDNFSGPETQRVVQAAQERDERVRYSRSPYPTSQRHNFELGLQAARGDYMSIIGDDDGFCIGSLDWLVNKLQRRPVDAVRWRLLHYVWPSLSTDGVGFANLYPAMCFGGSTYKHGEPFAEQALQAKTAGSWENILVYHGMISRHVYERMRGISKDVFFPYPMPDVYAHNIIPFFCGRVLQVNDIVSIYGTSGHSAGSSWTRVTSEDGRDASEGRRWMAETVADEVASRVPWQPDIRTLRYHDLSAYMLAESFGMLGGRKVDLSVWIKAIITEIKQSPWQLGPWLRAVEQAPFDGEVFSRVRREFEASTEAKVSVPGNKFQPDTRLPALRVRHVDPQLPDDVDGAAQAVARVISDAGRLANVAVNRYALPAEISMRGRLAMTIRPLALALQRRAPILSSRIIRSRYLPRPAWRFLKSLAWSDGNSSASAILARQIIKLHEVTAHSCATTKIERQNSTNTM